MPATTTVISMWVTCRARRIAAVQASDAYAPGVLVPALEKPEAGLCRPSVYIKALG